MADYQDQWKSLKSAFSKCGLGLMLFFGACYIVGACVIGEHNSFCEGYWRLNPNHQVYGKSVITVWGLVHGSVWFGMAICGFLAFTFSEGESRAMTYCFSIVFWVLFLFHIGWWMTGNYWIFTNAVIPQMCKEAKLGNATLYVLYYAVLIIEDVICGAMLLAALCIGTAALTEQLSETQKTIV